MRTDIAQELTICRALPRSQRAALPRIDVLIPAIEKDLRTLPHVVESVRLHSRNPVGEVIIVAPRKPSIQSLCRKNGWRFVDENTVLPITKQNIKYRSASWERSGWLFQQFLKLSGDKLCKADFFLVIDADTVLIRPHVFRSRGRTFFYTRDWTQPEYLRTYAKLMGSKHSSPRSLVTHYMLVEKTKLSELKQDIEARHGKAGIRQYSTASIGPSSSASASMKPMATSSTAVIKPEFGLFLLLTAVCIAAWTA